MQGVQPRANAPPTRAELRVADAAVLAEVDFERAGEEREVEVAGESQPDEGEDAAELDEPRAVALEAGGVGEEGVDGCEGEKKERRAKRVATAARWDEQDAHDDEDDAGNLCEVALIVLEEV